MAKSKSKPKPKSPFLGRWNIVSMSNWDEEDFNEGVQAYIEFRPETRRASSSSVTSRARSITVRGFGTASQASNGPGRAPMGPT